MQEDGSKHHAHSSLNNLLTCPAQVSLFAKTTFNEKNNMRIPQSKPHPWHGACRLDLGSQGQLLLVSFHKNASQIVVSHPQGGDTELLLLSVGPGTLQLQGRSKRAASFTTCLRALPLQPDTFVSGELPPTPSGANCIVTRWRPTICRFRGSTVHLPACPTLTTSYLCL